MFDLGYGTTCLNMLTRVSVPLTQRMFVYADDDNDLYFVNF